MKRLVSLLLIPMMLGHLTLSALSGPHSHSGTGVESPNDHAARPHVHVSGHGHFHSHGDHGKYVHGNHVHGKHVHGKHVHGKHVHGTHEHGDLGEGELSEVELASNDLPAIHNVEDHDCDAVYLTSSLGTTSKSLTLAQVDSAVATVFPEAVLSQVKPCRLQRFIPPQRYATLPVYLLTASLRL